MHSVYLSAHPVSTSTLSVLVHPPTERLSAWLSSTAVSVTENGVPVIGIALASSVTSMLSSTPSPSNWLMHGVGVGRGAGSVESEAAVGDGRTDLSLCRAVAAGVPVGGATSVSIGTSCAAPIGEFEASGKFSDELHAATTNRTPDWSASRRITPTAKQRTVAAQSAVSSTRCQARSESADLRTDLRTNVPTDIPHRIPTDRINPPVSQRIEPGRSRGSNFMTTTAHPWVTSYALVRPALVRRTLARAPVAWYRERTSSSSTRHRSLVVPGQLPLPQDIAGGVQGAEYSDITEHALASRLGSRV